MSFLSTCNGDLRGTLSCCFREVKSPLSCERSMGLCFSHCRGVGPHLAWAESRGVSQTAERFGFFSTATGTSGTSNAALGNHPPSGCQEHLRIPLMVLWGYRASSELRWKSQGSSPVATGISDFLLISTQGLRTRLLWGMEPAFLSSCKSGVRPPIEFRWGTWPLLEVQQQSQTSLCVVREYSVFH